MLAPRCCWDFCLKSHSPLLDAPVAFSVPFSWTFCEEGHFLSAAVPRRPATVVLAAEHAVALDLPRCVSRLSVSPLHLLRSVNLKRGKTCMVSFPRFSSCIYSFSFPCGGGSKECQASAILCAAVTLLFAQTSPLFLCFPCNCLLGREL